MAQPDRYAVIGHPVAHSRSPDIHAAFAAQRGEAIEYVRVLAPLDDFAGTLRAFRERGGRGANVTVPFKEQAFALATSLSPRAQQARAVNTLRFDANALHGDNTDGVGLVRDLRDNLGVVLSGRRLLLLGAGGAARGALGPLLEEAPAALMLVNRTAARAVTLASEFDGVQSCELADLAGERFDVVINATSASLAGDALALPDVHQGAGFAYDMMYGREETPFMRRAREQGARVADGLGMLVEQAAEAFLLWRGHRPRTQPVIAALRETLARRG